MNTDDVSSIPTDNKWVVHHVLPFQVQRPVSILEGREDPSLPLGVFPLGRHDSLLNAIGAATWIDEVAINAGEGGTEIVDLRTGHIIDESMQRATLAAAAEATAKAEAAAARREAEAAEAEPTVLD